MFVKKFVAATLEEALKNIKHELGEGALILSTTTQKGNLLKRGLVEVTAAKEKEIVEAKSKEGKEILGRSTFGNRKGSQNSVLTQLKRSESNLRESKYIDIGPNPDPVRVSAKKSSSERYEEGFRRIGIAPESARQLAHRLVMDFPKHELGHPVTLEKLKRKLIANDIRILSVESLLGYKSFVVMGPPGSGKTSYLVKLSLFLREKGMKIALASRERRKVSGPGEMAQYAKIIKAPFAHNLRERGREGCTLIDISAMSLRSRTFQNDLEQLLVTLDRPAPFIVLDATQRIEELLKVAEWVEKYQPIAVAFTKIDLSSNLGDLYEFLKKTKLPLLSLSVSDSFKSGLKFLGQLDLANLILSGGFRMGSPDSNYV